MVDSGAGGRFIDQNFASKFEMKKLDKPIVAYNVDGSENKKGTIKYMVDLEFEQNEKKVTETFFVTGLGKQKVILGFPWLREHNPIIDWINGKIKWATPTLLERKESLK